MVCACSPDIPLGSADLTLITPRCWNSLFLTHIPGENAAQFSALVTIHTVPIFIPPGTHCSWVDRGGVDSKLSQGFYTWSVMQESNPKPLDLGASALTTRPLAPQTSEIKQTNKQHISWPLSVCYSQPNQSHGNFRLMEMKSKCNGMSIQILGDKICHVCNGKIQLDLKINSEFLHLISIPCLFSAPITVNIYVV